MHVQHESLLIGDNAAYLDQLYLRWLDDPASVSADWASEFERWGRPDNGSPRPPSFGSASIFRGGGGAPVHAAPAAGSPEAIAASSRQAKVAILINAYRVRGHLYADIDPLDRREKVLHPELTLEYYGLGESDLDVPVVSAPLYGEPEISTLRRMVARLRAAYTDHISAEFMNIDDVPQKRWVQEALETLPDHPQLTKQDELRILRKLSDAENFERMLHTKFPGTKRFSLEGAETLVPLLDLLVKYSALLGVEEVVFGMAHRGRLNLLVNLFEKPVYRVVQEFLGAGQSDDHSGDVKYHLGYSSEHHTVDGRLVKMSLTPNPSHLEAVNPVVEGRARAKQDRRRDASGARVMPVLIHGDAAFAGQGVVAETLQYSELRGYRTGGTIHVIVNNQIGFTTPPSDARSTPYASGLARMLGVPIFHVNGEDPRSVAAVVRIASEWRARFHRDVVIDMYCYRKYGHNEGDEPAFTQPVMYAAIRRRTTPRATYAKAMIDSGSLSRAEVESVFDQSRQLLEDHLARVEHAVAPATRRHEDEMPLKGDDPDLDRYADKDAGARNAVPAAARFEIGDKGLWAPYTSAAHEDVETGVDLAWLTSLMLRVNTVPEGFTAHAKVARLLESRQEMARGDKPMDWALGEQAAFATVAAEGFRVRVSGQDVGRGTFSHRHAILTDIATAGEYLPLQHIADDQGAFDVFDSPLSEYAVLGFEYGYAFDAPDALVVWEAQFGDFANGAQILIDQFLAAAEQKWRRLNGLVMLLPHGYEGQGPEHSSARIERFLQLCAQDNLMVANPTTPAQLFHMLRRQVHRTGRKPLVVMSPKSLLRHPEATSTMRELAHGRYLHVIDDAAVADAQPGVQRVVLCSGKVYYDLLAERRERGEGRVALVRVETLYPFPHARIAEVVAGYPDGVELVWCQEEPRNMGAWPMFLHWFQEFFPQRAVRYVGRRAMASPAVGSTKLHDKEQRRLVGEALDLSTR